MRARIFPRRAAKCTAMLVLVQASAAGAANNSRIVPLSDREVFEVSLARTSGHVLSARGRTIVETRTGCGETHTLQRSLADVTYKDGRPIRTDFVIETWEGNDGHTMRFQVSNTQNGNRTEENSGTAMLDRNGAGQVTFTSHQKPFALPAGTMFPGAFGAALLAAAGKNHDLENQTVFQGGDRNALVTAAAQIGPRLPRPHEQARDSAHLLRNVSAWPILISYFPSNAELPKSEVAARLYANGLLGSLSLIYPEFTLRAKLVRVDRLPSSC